MAKRNTRRVKLEELFRWKAELPIKDHKGDEVVTVHQRIVSDTDYDKARLAALRKSREVRLALREKSTDEHAAMMESLERYNQEGLISVILLDRVDSYYKEAKARAQIKFPKSPGSDATQEDVEEYEAAVDGYDEKLNQEVLKVVEELSRKDRETMAELSEGELRELALATLENQICGGIFSAAFSERLAWLGTFKDAGCRNRYFNTFEQFEDLSKEVKDQLVGGYRRLSIGAEDLKN